MTLSSKIGVILAQVGTPATPTTKYPSTLQFINPFCDDSTWLDNMTNKVSVYA